MPSPTEPPGQVQASNHFPLPGSDWRVTGQHEREMESIYFDSAVIAILERESVRECELNIGAYHGR